jgi:hypothetical protein
MVPAFFGGIRKPGTSIPRLAGDVRSPGKRKGAFTAPNGYDIELHVVEVGSCGR